MQLEQRQPSPLHALLSAPAHRLINQRVVIKRGLFIYLLSRDAVDLRRKGMTFQASVHSGISLAEGWTFPLRASTTSCAGWGPMCLCPWGSSSYQTSYQKVEVIQEINQENSAHDCHFWRKHSPAKQYSQPLLNTLLLLTFTFFTLKIVN